MIGMGNSCLLPPSTRSADGLLKTPSDTDCTDTKLPLFLYSLKIVVETLIQSLLNEIYVQVIFLVRAKNWMGKFLMRPEGCRDGHLSHPYAGKKRSDECSAAT
jgi:hypothetical protein